MADAYGLLVSLTVFSLIRGAVKSRALVKAPLIVQQQEAAGPASEISRLDEHLTAAAWP